MSRTNWVFPRRKQRRDEAVERQSYYDSMTVVEKLAYCRKRRGESKKETARLKALS